MENFKSNEEILKALDGREYHVDTFGRVIIDDSEVLDMIKGAFGGFSADIPDVLWNGACSNQHC